jgi:hypothetical protein
MPDDKTYELLRAITQHIKIKGVLKNGKRVMQVELFTDEGVHIGDFIDGENYRAGTDLFTDLAAAKRFVDIEEAKPKLKTVPRIKRVK